MLYKPNIFITLLIIYIIIISLLFKYDFTGHVKQYRPWFIFASILGIFIISACLVFSWQKINIFNVSGVTATGTIKYLRNIGITLGVLLVIIGIIYLLVYTLSSPNNYTSSILTVINIIIIILTCAFIIQQLNINLNKNSYFSLLLNYILYIPCQVINIIKFIKHEYNITTKTSLIILCLDILFIIIHFNLRSTYKFLTFSKNKKILSELPLYLNKETTIGTFENLYESDDSDKWKYNYAINLELYINPQPPNTNYNYNKYITIFDYGNKPLIQYKANTNTLKFSVKLNDTTNKTLLIKHKLLLQKWNNIVINYIGGTMDIFLNKKLIGTYKSIAPYMKYDIVTTGTNNGISGGIKNVIYYAKSLTLREINNL